ncbi:Receptor-like serine/threonine-protein kinase ALE2 [Morella rubra]|uniref:Receptor-like serine/threonine-protein kinase ALE2 n=1 Tax=Morella rubra TaxID=262757 RepID=A0A6A1V0N7_9ROSI|nr:Receptor-like serine/threonine-protein kinase ALE2 [Morella rubra]
MNGLTGSGFCQSLLMPYSKRCQFQLLDGPKGHCFFSKLTNGHSVFSKCRNSKGNSLVFCLLKTMKSAYYSDQDARFQPPDGSPVLAWEKLWKAKSQPRLKLLLWKFASRLCLFNPNFSFSLVMLAKSSSSAPLCNSEVETEEHLAFQCLFVKIIWGDLLISGVLEDGTKVLAVKVLKRVDQQGGREFLLAEVEMISRGLHHPNLTFSASDIEKVTDNFYASRVLGEGGFGLVYSGVLGDGTKVAIKVLN